MLRRAAALAALLSLPVLAAGAQPPPAPITPGAPSTAALPAASAASPLTVGETFTIASRVLGEVRRINVYAPPGALRPGAPPLPVLYMPDGGLGEDFLHVAGLVQVSTGNGTMRPVLLVGIENTERRRDLTGPTSQPADRRIAARVGGSAAFRAFLRDELLPTIAARYATTSERAIVGESLAGLFVVETLLEEPTLFDRYVALDPSLWWDDGRLVRTAAERLRAGAGPARALFLASSSEPVIAAATRALADVLQDAAIPGLRWDYRPMPDESHATIYHPAALRAFRRLLAPPAAP